ncbi:MAG: glycosyltransferase [Firmicutes bacterium]|nr:glycosyltransferase [Alicyclobacillaceae bacterium]MCL6497135.1 glycosyltransferase [Bacillota bacterium]
MLKEQDIVCISSADWDAPLWTNKQHLMSRLAESNRILYVESLGLRTPTLAPQDRQRIKRRVKHYFLGPRKIPGKNVYVLSPLVIPYYRTAALRALNAALLRREVLQAVRRLDMREPILWSYIPNAYALTHHLKEKLVVYHCVDDLASIAGVPRHAVQSMEERFLREADAVLTTSRALYEARVAINPNTYLFTNVADADHFAQALEPELPVAPAIAALPRPIAGYVGALDAYKVDFPFLAAVARQLSDWSFVLIGPVGQGQPSTDLGDLKRLPNVHLLGYVEYQRIPSYLKGIDVALIPHRLSEYTQSSFPMKLYEYLAAGRPVVSTPLPAIAEVDLVRFAATPEAFAQAVVAAWRENSPEAVARRVEEARKHTWESRLKSFDEVLERVWQSQRQRRQSSAP